MLMSIKARIEAIGQLDRLLSENLADAIWVLDANTLIYEYITPSILKISGYEADDLIGTSVLDRLTTESLKAATDMWRRVLLEYQRGIRTMRSMELELANRNGDTYWVEIRAKFFEEPDAPMKLIGLTRDITSRKRAEKEQADLNMRLAAALAEKERLLKEMKILKALLPICSGCRRIRDDHGKWWPLEIYVKEHTNSSFSHTICPDCKDVLYPEMK